MGRVALSSTTSRHEARRRNRSRAVLLLSVLLAALVLRGPLAVVPPVLADLRRDLGLSRSSAALVTALPVLCFGVLAIPAARSGARHRVDTVLVAAMALLAAALLLRSFGGTAGLLLGTAVVGASITVGNVLVPVVVKRDFPDRTAAATALYVTAMTGGAAVASALSVPTATFRDWGWRGALAVWSVPALLAALALHRASRTSVPRTDVPVTTGTGSSVWRSPVAWQLAAYTGLQALLFYSVLTWLPTLLRDDGVTPQQAGLALVLFTAVGVPASLLAPLLSRGREQRLLLLGPCLLWTCGLAGLLLAPAQWLLWSVVLGAGQGSGLSLSLAQVPLRAATVGLTGRLAAMTQTTGYVLAAGGPWLVGAARDAAGDWQPALVLLLVVSVSMGLTAVAVGRPTAVVDGRRRAQRA